jgi:LuxR family transcriptional regulator, maltose regulon positive regulatory protein
LIGVSPDEGEECKPVKRPATTVVAESRAGADRSSAFTTPSQAKPRRRRSSPVLLETKFYPPALHDRLIPRDGLVGMLAAGASGRRLTLISAPPGFGKTTLIAQWAESDGSSDFAWLTLEAGDDEPQRLLSYLTEALARIVPRVRRSTRANGREAVPALLNALAAHDRQVVLAIDDYHTIHDEGAHAVVTYLIEHGPPSLHVVVSTRSDPPLRLGRLRVAGELNELRAADLRMTREEAERFLNERLDLRLDGRDVDVLNDRTEGWPAGLYLAALTLQQHDDPSAFVESFAGDNRHVADYLSAEVLRAQTTEVREFLLATAVLDRFSAPLCDAVLGSNRAGELLRELEASNLFLVPLDDRGEWFRYHHLFAELLRADLNARDPREAPTLHRHAVDWFAENDSIESAVRHALAAGDEERAIELIAGSWYRYIHTRQLGEVDTWLRALGPERVAAEPRLALGAAWISIAAGQQEDTDHWFALAASGDPEADVGGMPLAAALALLESCMPRRGVSSMRAAAERFRAFEVTPQPLALRQVSDWSLAYARYYGGVGSDAREPAENAVRAVSESPNHLINVASLGLLALMKSDDGDTPRARALARQADELAERTGLAEDPVRGTVLIAHGRALAREGDLEGARSLLEAGIELRRASSNRIDLVFGLLDVAPIRRLLGDSAGARAALREAGVLANSGPDLGTLRALLEKRSRKLRVSIRKTNGVPDPLSDRELTVLRLLGGTLSRRDIGRELGISTDTVKSHVRAIYRKLGVASRPEAVEHAKDLGIKLY